LSKKLNFNFFNVIKTDGTLHLKRQVKYHISIRPLMDFMPSQVSNDRTVHDNNLFTVFSDFLG